MSRTRRSVPERLDHVEVAAEREWPGDVVVGVRAFRQRVDDQVVTLFGVARRRRAGRHRPLSRRLGRRLRRPRLGRQRQPDVVNDALRASVDYTQTDADVAARGPPIADALSALAPSVLRRDERIHDLTASVESVSSPTATRFFVVYKLNTRVRRRRTTSASCRGANARFDVQVNQALPFLNFTSAQWEMLVAVSNLFRDDWSTLGLRRAARRAAAEARARRRDGQVLAGSGRR